MSDSYDFTIEDLGPRTIESPINLSKISGDFMANYVNDDEFVRYKTDVIVGDQPSLKRSQVLKRQGPGKKFIFTPARTRGDRYLRWPLSWLKRCDSGHRSEPVVPVRGAADFGDPVWV